jgi:hypothetical protein
MEFIGQPFSIQTTTGPSWLVTWRDAVRHTVEGELLETVSFTVAVPRNGDLSVSEVQTFALKRAVELLQMAIREHRSP